jgi:hypothetical protein
MYTKFLSENLKGRDHLKDLVIEGRINIRMNSKESVAGVWTGFIWLRIWTSGRLL